MKHHNGRQSNPFQRPAVENESFSKMYPTNSKIQTASDNRTLIRSGEARPVGWSRQMLYLGFNNLPRSVFWSAYLNARSDNLDVMPLKFNDKNI